MWHRKVDYTVNAVYKLTSCGRAGVRTLGLQRGQISIQAWSVLSVRACRHAGVHACERAGVEFSFCVYSCIYDFI